MSGEGDEYLVDEDVGHEALVRYTGSERPTPSQLRGDPRFVEPVELRFGRDAAPFKVDELRGSIEQEFGFAPREIHVTQDRAGGIPGVALLVYGEVMEAAAADDASIRALVTRHLYRMVGTDDVIDLLAFARLEAPVAIDRVVPHRIGVETLLGVTQRLLRDGVPIKPFARLVELFGAAPRELRDVEYLTARVRMARRRTIVDRARQADGVVRVVRLAPGAEQACRVLAPMGPGVLEDERMPNLVERLQRDLRTARSKYSLAPLVIVCSPEDRVSVARMSRRIGSEVVIVGRDELGTFEHDQVGIIGAGIHVSERTPPSPPGHPGVWSTSGVASPHREDWGATHDEIVDVEILE